jgi:Na+/H+-dicarboxylate symporter
MLQFPKTVNDSDVMLTLKKNMFSLSILTHRNIQTIVLVMSYLACARFLPLSCHRFLYSISILLKDMLVFMMPITVCFFISYTMASFQKKALVFITALLVFEFMSNFLSVWFGYACGHVTQHWIDPLKVYTDTTSLLIPLFKLPFHKPAYWTPDKGVIVGVILGLLPLQRFLNPGKKVVEIILSRFFARLIPLFILGFLANMYCSKMLIHIIHHYGTLVIFLLLFLAIYIAFIFLVGSNFSLKKTIESIQNLLPAGGVAVTSSCSLSTMPLTIEGTSKNLENPELAKALIPATTNVQQIGDCIVNSFLCFLICSSFMDIPSAWVWLKFSIVFAIARFATTAVIGGAIFLMIPIYEAYLGFKPEMVALILALNVVLDPIVTVSNVMANGGLCRVFERFLKKFI